MSPRISILIAAYNADRFLGAAIESALAQDYPEVEVVVVDDGSTDHTGDILSAFGSKVTIIRQLNAGVSAARNAAAAAAAGDLLVLLDADDLLLSNCVSRRVALLDDGVGLVAGATLYIDEDGEPIRGAVDLRPHYSGGITYKDAMHRVPGPPSGWLIPKRVFEEVGGFDTNLRVGEDLDLCLRILAKYKGQNDPEPLVCYREVGGSASRSFLVQFDQLRQIARKHRGIAPAPLFSYWWDSRVMLLTTVAGISTRLVTEQGIASWLRFLAQRPPAVPYALFWVCRAFLNRALYKMRRGPLYEKELALKSQSK
jgi:glycosyltransferase involved in cell wall biosynthesis